LYGDFDFVRLQIFSAIRCGPELQEDDERNSIQNVLVFQIEGQRRGFEAGRYLSGGKRLEMY